MSKSYSNHIGLTFEPRNMFGKVMSVPDEATAQPRFSLILKYYQLGLGVLVPEVTELAKRLDGGSLDPRDAKEELAWRVVETYHGRPAADEARADFIARFRKKDAAAALELAEEKELPADLFGKDAKVWIPKLLATIGAASSSSEGRRLVQQGGVRLRGEVLADPQAQAVVNDGDLLEVGKRKKYKLTFE